MKKLAVAFCFLLSLGPNVARSVDRWPVPSPCPLITTYGEYQKGLLGGTMRKFLHEAIDIKKPAGTAVTAVDSGYITFYGSDGLSDTSWMLYTGYTGNDSGPGWVYAHIVPKKKYQAKGVRVNIGDKLGTVVTFSTPSLSHLHFVRCYGILGPGSGIFIGWNHCHALTNPLELLPSISDTVKPKIDTTWFYRDTSQASLPLFRKTSDSIAILDRKVDIVPRTYDHVPDTSSDTTTVGVYKIQYKVDGPGTQNWKGFTFTGILPDAGWNPDTARADTIATLTYRHGGALCFDNLCSNTRDSAVFVPESLVGYWSTKKKAGGAETDTATQQSEAAFPDGRYTVITRARDYNTNSLYDTTKVIVNNFPPKIKKTYPDSGGVNFVSGDSIRIWFDQPMDTASAKAAFHLQLKGSGSDVVGDTLFSGDTLLIFAPSETLRLDTVYVVRIDSTARDIADSTMLNPYEFPFSTQRTVMLFGVRESPNYNSLQQFDSLASYPPLQTYDAYTGIGPVAAQMLCYDRDGNNYVIHWTSDIGSNYVGKFSYTGGSLGQYLQGRKYRSITTDGDSLFLLQRSPTDTTRYQYMLKTSLFGDSGSCFFMSNANRWTANAVWYNPWDNLLYVAWSDTLPRDTCWVRKYQRNGTPAGGDLWVKPYNGYFKFVMSNDRLALLATYGGAATPCWVAVHPLSNWNNPTYLNLNNYAPYGATSSLVYGAAASPVHFYLAVRSDFSYSWIARFDRNGQFAGSILPPDAFYGAMAVFPPAIRFPKATYTPPIGGDGDGGSQSADVNSLLPRIYALAQSYPNPANGGLRIDYALPKESHVNLRIYNVSGQLVRTLREGEEKPGFYKAEWDGKDQNGHRVSSGVYLYRMEAGEFRKTRKLVVVR